MSLTEQIEEFNSMMNKVVGIVEETKDLAKKIPDISIGEAPAKIKEIIELCDEGMKHIKEASEQAEEIRSKLGG